MSGRCWRSAPVVRLLSHLSRACNGRDRSGVVHVTATARPWTDSGRPGRTSGEGSDMCLNCGCGTPEDRYGDEANITADDLRQAADANCQTLDDTVRNLRDGLDKLGQASPAGA